MAAEPTATPRRRRHHVAGQRKHRITITFSDAEHAQIAPVIATAGMSEGAWCAEVVLAAACGLDLAAPVPPERLAELAATVLPALAAAHGLRQALTDADPAALDRIEAHAAAAEAALTALLRGRP